MSSRDVQQPPPTGGTSPSSKPAHLEPSELGTKEYWDELYAAELRNHLHDPSDTGTVWFDDADAEAKVIGFLVERSEQEQEQDQNQHQDRSSSSSSSSGNGGSGSGSEKGGERKKKKGRGKKKKSEMSSFLDLGTGNGALLFGLRDAGFARARMLGVDYSARSVEFARRIAEARRRSPSASPEPEPVVDEKGEDEGENEKKEETQEEEEEEEEEAEVEFAVHDILRDPASRLLTGAQADGWDVVLDKGTFDAISLSAETEGASASSPDDGQAQAQAQGQRRVSEGYKARVLPLVRPGGLFLVTSCNWTEDELRRWFLPRGRAGGVEQGEWEFEQVGRVEYPSFSFGGVKGQAISSVCYRKVRKNTP